MKSKLHTEPLDFFTVVLLLSAAIVYYKLFRRNWQGRRGRGIALYVKKWIDCEELSLKNSHKQAER